MIAKGDGTGDQPFAEAVQREIATRLTEHQYLTWFQRVNFCRSGPDRVAVSVPNRFFMTYLKQRYLPVIAESIESVTSLERPRIDSSTRAGARAYPARALIAILAPWRGTLPGPGWLRRPTTSDGSCSRVCSRPCWRRFG